MALRSKPTALTPVLTRTGKQAFRVTVSIGGKQRKRQFMMLADAEAQRDTWEMERVSAAAALRPKVTRLTQAQLVVAEACFEMLKGTTVTLPEAVRFVLRNPPAPVCQLTFDEAYKQFLEARKPYMSNAQHANYLSPCRRLAAHLGEKAKLIDVDTATVQQWLTSLDVKSKSWNNYRGDLAVVFNWFMAAPRRWISENPATALPRFRRRDTLPGPIDVLQPKTAQDLMHWLQREMPHWVPCFALALFGGVRPDRDDGEMSKLANAIGRDGLEVYFRNGTLLLTPEITKDGRLRRVPLPENLQAWQRLYPVTEESLRGGTRDEYAAIRARWKIPFDGLRHTSISACASLHGITESAVRHGNSEKICRDNYLFLFPKEDAKKFYDIYPAPLSGNAQQRPCETPPIHVSLSA